MVICDHCQRKKVITKQYVLKLERTNFIRMGAATEDKLPAFAVDRDLCIDCLNRLISELEGILANLIYPRM